jgi:hypothetical protein
MRVADRGERHLTDGRAGDDLGGEGENGALKLAECR